MGLSLVGVSSPVQRGIEAAETGVNLESIEVRYFHEVKERLKNYQGQTRGFALTDKFSRVVTVDGEVDGSTGLMASVGNAAATFSNDVSDFVAVTSGTNAGGFYLDEATVSQSRDGWRRVNLQYSSDPLVT